MLASSFVVQEFSWKTFRYYKTVLEFYNLLGWNESCDLDRHNSNSRHVDWRTSCYDQNNNRRRRILSSAWSVIRRRPAKLLEVNKSLRKFKRCIEYFIWSTTLLLALCFCFTASIPTLLYATPCGHTYLEKRSMTVMWLALTSRLLNDIFHVNLPSKQECKFKLPSFQFFAHYQTGNTCNTIERCSFT